MEETMTVNSITNLAADDNQYLTFTLGEEEYGIDILKVQEIKGYSAVTRIPRSPAYVKGVMNLRGTIVPVIDLRTKFGLEPTAYDQFTVIIVVVVQGRAMGLIVDTVSDVLNIPASDVQPTPELSSDMDTNFIAGMGKAGDKLIILLDVHKVLGVEELRALEAAT
ncbi:MAG: chemotaxis protein CheW [Candidatus Binatia bacterium]